MAVNPIRLTRNVLSQFLPDHDSIRQFEKLLDVAGNAGAITFITTGGGTEFLSDDGTYSTPDHGSIDGLGDDDHTQYHTDARALTWLGTRSTTDLSEGTNLYWTQSRFDTAFTAKSTTDLSEGTNLYFTNARVTTVIDADTSLALVDGSRPFTGTVTFQGGIVKSTVTKVNDYTVVATDSTIVADGTSNTVTITLPAAPTTGQVFNIACLNSTFAVDVDFNGKNFYDSATNETLFKGENLKVQYDGTQWVGA